jgi:3-hydroxyisobutyrate dehydrogenase-like beta-hydroxyacid dehydrogenase
MPEPSVGFIGLGIMGGAMSGHLLGAGFQVTGYDTDGARMGEHAARGGSTAESAAAVADNAAAAASAGSAGSAGTGVVVTSLPSAQALIDVVDGDGGIGSGKAAGLVVIETSTLPLEVKEQARKSLAAHGNVLLDCPLSGTGAQAARKDLIAYVSGDDDAKARAAPVLDGMTRGYFDVGPFGNGTKMKIVANHLVAVHNLAAAEALLLAERAGLDLAMVLEAIGDGAGTSRMFEVRGPIMAAGDYAAPGMRTRVFQKDIDIIDAFASALRSPTPLFSLASVFYRAALAEGRGEDDASCVHAVLKQLAAPDP